jgi:hypothetical protein
MSRKSKAAIKVLEGYLNRLENISTKIEGNTWKDSLRDTFILYFGENSAFIQRLDVTYFTKTEYTSSKSPNVISANKTYLFDSTKKSKFKELVKSAIDHIESHGLQNSIKSGNYFHSFSNVQIISGLVFLITTLISLGYYFGTFNNEREIVRLDNEINKLKIKKEKDSLLIKSLNDIITELKKMPDSVQQNR